MDFRFRHATTKMLKNAGWGSGQGNLISLIRKKLILGLLLSFVLVYVYFLVVVWKKQSRRDLDCTTVVRMVTDADAVLETVSNPDQPGISCEDLRTLLGKPFGQIRIYGITDKEKQDLVIGALQAIPVQSLKNRAITVSFYNKKKNPMSREYEPQTPIRDAQIK
jgi:hypothetical protein